MLDQDSRGESSRRWRGQRLRIAFCTPCMNRLVHLRKTLPRNLEDNDDYTNLVFVILDYGDRQGVGGWIKENFAEHLRAGRLVYYRNPEPEFFHMAHSKNMAHRCGVMEQADVLVNMDADNYTGRGFANCLNDVFSRHVDIFMRTGDAVKSATRGLGGRIAVRLKAFCAVGGYDERFDKWGADDRDFAERLDRARLRQIDIDPGFLETISHSDEQRAENYDSSITARSIAAAYASRFRLEGREHIVVVNSSKGGCYAGSGTVYRNFSPDPTELTLFSTQRVPGWHPSSLRRIEELVGE